MIRTFRLRTIPGLLLLLVISSCIPQKNILILQDPITEPKTYSLSKSAENLIKPGDELYISVSSFDNPDFNFLGGGSQDMRTGYSNEISLTLISYTVRLDGSIYFPVIGSVDVNGNTTDEVRIKLERLLKDYLNQPTVNVKFSFKKVTILGEVLQPGYYTYTKEKINILEALGMANDLTIHSDPRKVFLMRHDGNEVQKILIDLTNDTLVFSKYYYLEADDIIYVNPRKSAKWSASSVPINVLFSSITTVLSLTTTIVSLSTRIR